MNDSIDLTDQWTDNRTWANSMRARLSWTEPIGNVRNGNFLTLAYSVNLRWNNADRLTYDYPVEWPDGWTGDPVIGSDLEFNDELSNRFRNTYISHDIRAGFKHVSKKSTLDVGLSLVPQSSRSDNLLDDARSIPTRNVLNVAPYLRYRMKFSRQSSLNMHYAGRSSQPSMTQLQPVADMTDPLNIVIGNPNLKPTFTHNFNIRFQDFNAEAQRSIMVMAFANMTQNSIVSRTSFDNTTGGRTTTYENVNGVWSVRAMTMYSQPLRNKAFTFNNHLMGYYSRGVGFNNGERNVSGSYTIPPTSSLSCAPATATSTSPTASPRSRAAAYTPTAACSTPPTTLLSASCSHPTSTIPPPRVIPPATTPTNGCGTPRSATSSSAAATPPSPSRPTTCCSSAAM